MKRRYYSKYGNKKVTIDGYTFDSKHESERYLELKLLEKAKEISDLQLQVKFVLIPSQREESTEVYKKGIHKGEPKPGKFLEHEVAYIADFVYKDKYGNMVVEDAKGYKGGGAYAVFIIKRKLMLYIHKIQVKEV